MVLAATGITLLVGLAIKWPCVTGDWADGRQYRRLCYTDIVPLYTARGIDDGRVPYLEARNEYPVLTGAAMWAAGVPARSYASFFGWTAAMLAAAAFATAWALHRLVGRRALFFAAAPTLAIYGFMNWDLLAVAPATLAVLLYPAGRYLASGAEAEQGAAAKLYPALFVLPLGLRRLQRGDRTGAIRLAAAALAVWSALNLIVAIAAPDGWAEFFRFSAERPADWDSLWLLAGHHLGWPRDTGTVNAAAALSFLGLAALTWWRAARRRPGFPAWTFAFPLLVLFLVTSKVYSPQFSLWLLPWFALALPHLGLFVVFSAAEVAVFVTRFTWFANVEAHPFPAPEFQAAIVVRAIVLLACVAAWVRRPAPEVTPETRSEAAR